MLETRINSIEKLELVMALRQSPSMTLPIQAIESSLQIPRDVVRQLVMQLRAATLVDLTAQGQVQLLTASDADEDTLGELEELFQTDSVRLIQHLSDLAIGKIRRMAARVFVTALVARGNGDGGD